MEMVIPWYELIKLIESHAFRPIIKGGRAPYPLETMLRIHLLRQWNVLRDHTFTLRREVGWRLLEDAFIKVTMIN